MITKDMTMAEILNNKKYRILDNLSKMVDKSQKGNLNIQKMI
ncbi:hypothetical protein [Clostridium sp. UBA6640]|nr:hypothetical protein [Clostridium sp. UBA6640]